MGFDVVERVEVFHHILKHLFALFDDAICSEEKDVVDVRLEERDGEPAAVDRRVLTSLSVEAGDVGGRFLVVGGQAFVVLSSLAVLLPSLSPSGSVPDNYSNE